MLGLTDIKNYLPYALIAIVAFLLLRLNSTNDHLLTVVALKEETIALKDEEIAAGNSRNEALAEAMSGIAKNMQINNELLDKEAKRRAAAEMKSLRLNEEIKNALKDNRCNVVLVPADATERLRNYSDSIRADQNTNSPDPGKSVN